MPQKILKWVQDNVKVVIVGVLVIVIAFVFIRGQFSNETDEVIEADVDEYQLLIEKCQISVPDGYIVTSNCDLLPAGNSDLSTEDVGYTFLRALSNLDFETAARYSYDSTVIKQYSRYYDLDNDYSYDQDFKRSLYKQVLLSLIVQNVTDISTFADGKVAITYTIEVLDLTDKDFWLQDQDELFTNLEKYRGTESDTTKAKEYLYDYVLSYYQSDEAKTRTTTVTLVIDKVSGQDYWVVSDDSAIDAIAKYLDGETSVSYIMLQFDKQR